MARATIADFIDAEIAKIEAAKTRAADQEKLTLAEDGFTQVVYKNKTKNCSIKRTYSGSSYASSSNTSQSSDDSGSVRFIRRMAHDIDRHGRFSARKGYWIKVLNGVSVTPVFRDHMERGDKNVQTYVVGFKDTKTSKAITAFEVLGFFRNR